MSSPMKIGFLGAGRMATALAKGFIQAGLTTADRMIASDPIDAARDSMAREGGVKTTPVNGEVMDAADVLILAVKPDQVSSVLTEIKPKFTSRHLMVSIAAGVPLARMEAALPDGARVVRVMPNTPALVGASASAFAVGRSAQPEDAALVEKLFSAVGLALRVKESLLDAVTGLSGSGPAYAFLIIEALSDGGVAAGLPRDVATRLAAQTLLGSARLLLESGQHPGALKDMVTSPGGTTVEGLHELEKAGVRGALINAVRAASEKSKRLGQA
ncbi:MAG TPA: pyrroline-5-carboxylate reductase [Verrucomicrobiae bacterium]|nr:pyrroline-5-carboxylate reductase [Verrucomicrobiae bacterium]